MTRRICALPGGLASLALLTGCAELVGADFDSLSAKPVTDARCDPAAPFGAPERLPLNDLLPEAWAPRLSSDELALYFVSQSDAFVAQRSHRSLAFSSFEAIASLNSSVDEMASSVTADGREIYLETTRAGATVKLFGAYREHSTSPFSTPAPLLEVNSSDDSVLDVQPFVLPDGSALYFASTRHPGRDFDLFRAARDPATGRFGEPVSREDVNSLTPELWPVLTPNELVMYFASARNGGGASGGYDVYVTRRQRPSESFGTAENVTELNGESGDYPGWVSADECVLYLTRTTPNRTIFVARRPPPAGSL